eukprot:augustus_masked-scaffold_9-processed-gene-9.45-mRNA-1 protein AED:1.00 eAED:1.00 QI:0/-1/0/0/-1/1/1/0/396
MSTEGDQTQVPVNLHRESLVPEVELQEVFVLGKLEETPVDNEEQLLPVERQILTNEETEVVEKEVDDEIAALSGTEPVRGEKSPDGGDSKGEETLQKEINEEPPLLEEDKNNVESSKELIKATEVEKDEKSVAEGTDSDEKLDEEKEEPAAEEKEINFEAKTPSGRVYKLSHFPETTIIEVKNTIAKLSDSYIEASEMNLIFKGKSLLDTSQTLVDVGINSGDKIFVIKKLLGRQKSLHRGKKIGPRIERTEDRDRGYLTITIPEGAGPQSRLIISPPGRSNLVVYVPRGHRPGDTLRIQLPDEPGDSSNQRTSRNNSSRRNGNTAAAASSDQPAGGPSGPGAQKIVIMKAKCPQDVQPGGEVELNLPGRSEPYKVQVPMSCLPGEDFYFRVLPGV